MGHWVLENQKVELSLLLQNMLRYKINIEHITKLVFQPFHPLPFHFFFSQMNVTICPFTMEILQKRKKHQSRLALVNLSSMFMKHHRSENSVVKSWWSNRFLSSIVENVPWLLYTFLLLSYYIKKEVPNFADTDWNILLSHRSSYFKKTLEHSNPTNLNHPWESSFFLQQVWWKQYHPTIVLCLVL